MRYFKVLTETPWRPEPWWQRTVKRVLFAVLPMANPDFESLYPSVRSWLLEVDESNRPIREVGMDHSGTPLVIGPFGRNYGFWTDPGEPLDNFGLSMAPSSQQEFESAWQQVSRQTASSDLGS